jgi:hypothetical protein
MRDMRGIALIGDLSRKRIVNPAPALGKREKNHTAVGG